MASAVEPVQQHDDDVEWTDECNELLGQVLETQTEIASLLKDHGDTQKSLEVMKKQCDEEVSISCPVAHGTAAVVLYSVFLGCSVAEHVDM